MLLHDLFSNSINLDTSADVVHTPRPSKEVQPLIQSSERGVLHHTTPRRSLPTVPLTSPMTSLTRDITTPTRPKSRSYMSPTTSSMAKISRSVSMGDNLNLVDLEEPGSSDPRPDFTQSKPTTPVATLSSPNTTMAPFPGPYTPHAAVAPTVSAGSSESPFSKSLQAKVTSSARPLLHIDIPNPLPDKPSLSSLSPSSRSPRFVQKEKGFACRTPTTPSSLHEGCLVQPVKAVRLTPSETADRIDVSMVLISDQSKDLSQTELDSNAETEREGTIRDECFSTGQCSPGVLQDSGLMGYQSSVVQSSVLLRLGLPKHFFTKGLWPLSSSITSFISSSPPSSINHYHLKGEAWLY